MDVDVLRDWVIVVYGGVGVIGICIVLAVVLVLFRKVTNILDAVEQTADNVRQTSSVLSESVIQPIGKAHGFIAGIRKGIDIISSLSKTKDEGEKHGEQQ